MKKYISVLVILLLATVVVAQEEPPEEEEEAGGIGPEHGFLHAFDIVADNIAAFLSRIGGEKTHANTVRRIVAERRAEHLRLLRLKNEGEITSQEFSKMVSGLNEQIQKKEQALNKAEERIAEKEAKQKGNIPAEPASISEQKSSMGSEKGKSAGKDNR